ncbi:hypothetical protein SY88_13385 [Clostridiales bacterium PH28_bin88]|nr:hypothetical protein SY88_13385 [Clostridiales bacterium PH28_bin88]
MPLIFNCLWLCLCLKKYLAFKRAVHHVEKTQQRVLLNIIARNKGTDYGKKYSFDRIAGVESFQASVPISTYESYKPYIEAIADGRQQVLTGERVTMLEPTSGSTCASKYIPYTKSLREEFQQGIAPWVFDLYSHRKKMLLGKAYWSISPAGSLRTRTTGGVPVGFEEDTGYFGFLERYFLKHLLVVPKEVAQISHMETFRYVTLLFLLKEKRLSFISVWNPTFLTLLLKPLTGWADRLISDIKSGTVSPPGPIRPDILSKLSALVTGDEKRAEELTEILAGDLAGREPNYRQIWPDLALISCWADASAGSYLYQLKELFPGVEIQGKGLLATEGIVSFPLTGVKGSALAVTSHFFEFAEAEGQGDQSSIKIRRAHELERGKSYSVIITTGGGLYRYRLQDLIRVEGFLGQCPLITFTGKEDQISDLFGEKLSESHVDAVMHEVFVKYELRPRFYMVAPEKTADGRHFYTLFIELDEGLSQVSNLVNDVELRLRENYHYQYCRTIGQLDGLRLFVISKGGLKTYLEGCASRGQRLGDVKPVALHKHFGWSGVFEGNFVNPGQPEVTRRQK